nr:probable glutamate receptor [Procambarus clarkii]
MASSLFGRRDASFYRSFSNKPITERHTAAYLLGQSQASFVALKDGLQDEPPGGCLGDGAGGSRLMPLGYSALLASVSLNLLQCGVYLQVPYSPLGAQALKVASWTPQRGLALTSSLPLFPDKFSKFIQRPTLTLAAEINALITVVNPKEDEAGEKVMLQFAGPAADLVSYLAKGLNFSYKYMRPPDGSSGSKREDGSWSGMVGMVIRQEIDVAVGPFGVSAVRAEVVDFTVPILTDYGRILGARGRPEVDPWGFLFPLEPLVWAAILGALLVLPLTTLLMASCFSPNTHGHNYIVPPTSAFLRILLYQCTPFVTWTAVIKIGCSENGYSDIGGYGANVLDSGAYWWWERVVLTVWGLVTVVLTQSYAGNLMALLAVRHIPQPYQSLRDVLDDRSVTTVWEQGSSNVQFVREAEFGIYREIAGLKEKGRLIYKPRPKFTEIIDTLVRRGDHILMDIDFSLKIYMSEDFTESGQCSFYKSKEEFMPLMFALVSEKGSPLVSPLNDRILGMTEAGLFKYWMRAAQPNSTVCSQAPTTITVQESLSLNNVMGMFVLLAGGHSISVLVLCLELVAGSTQH